MKLHTSIPPRRDGTVKVTGQDRQTYVFEADANGDLSCDVADEADLAMMLATDNFYPADPEDANRAADLLQQADKADEGQDAGDSGADGDDSGEPEDEGDEPVNENAMPVEANTPPAPARARRAAGKGSKSK